MSFIFTYTAAVLTIVFVSTAAFLFLKGKKDNLTQIFIFYVLAGAVWIGGNAAADIAQTENTLIVTSGIAFAGGTFIVSFFLIFVDTFVDNHLPSNRRMALYLLPSILFSIFSFSEYAIVETVFPPDQPAQIIPGFQYQLAFICLLSSLIYGLVRLLKESAKSYGRRHLQTLYIIIGFSSLLVGEIFFSVLLPLLGELRFFGVAPQFSLVFVIASGYAIFKHNLLDIRIAVQRGFIYILLLVGILSTYLAVLYVSGLLLQPTSQAASIVSAAITTIIGVFSVPYIDTYLRDKTDKFFFKNKYNYASALYGLSEQINKTILVEDIKEKVEVALGAIFKTKIVSIRMVDEHNADELATTSNLLDHTSLTVSIISNDLKIGDIFLGEKQSGDCYSGEDMVLIRTFANQIATAFEKAKLYKEVLDYSEGLEKRVEERTKQVADLQKNQEVMMLDIAHRLQNPLTIIKGELNLLLKNTSQKSELLFFEKTIDDTSAFIYDLLRLARIEMAPEFLQKERLDLSSHMFELVEYFDVMTRQNDIEFLYQIEPDIILNYDKKSLSELVTNLVSNAVKYIGEPRPAVAKTISVSLRRKNDSILLTVSDNGIGIPAVDLPNIFNRFYRSNTKRHASIGGTGLGLTICKKIVEIHEGEISVTSDTQTGSVFTITFNS